MESKADPNEWSSGVWIHLTAVRQHSPLVQCITNFVSMDLVANTLLSAGASPAMVAVSGAVDIVTDGKQVIGLHNGTKMMQKITATGCSLAGLIAAFLAIDPLQPLEATVSAMSVFGIAGELGEAMSNGPASLRMHLIDALYGLDETTVLNRVKITRLD